MKIVRPGDGSLVIQVRPGIPEYLLGLAVTLPLWILLIEGSIPRDQLWGVLAGSAIAAVGLSFLVEISDFTFDANRSQLRWSRKTLYGSEQGQVALADIRDVSVSSYEKSGGAWLHRVWLTVPSGALSPTRYSQTGRQSEVVAQAIREFLAGRGLATPRAADRTNKRSVVGFHQDSRQQWVAQLECGHHLHIPHKLPWVVTPEGRADALGKMVDCLKCASGAPPDTPP